MTTIYSCPTAATRVVAAKSKISNAHKVKLNFKQSSKPQEDIIGSPIFQTADRFTQLSIQASSQLHTSGTSSHQTPRHWQQLDSNWEVGPHTFNLISHMKTLRFFKRNLYFTITHGFIRNTINMNSTRQT